MKHIVDPKSETWYHLDAQYRVHTCPCRDGSGMSLCLTIDDTLDKEGKIRELDHQIAMKRKQLGLKIGEPMPE